MDEELALTTDGGPAVRNGLLDWVYQEEIYGRGNFRERYAPSQPLIVGVGWTPDSRRVVFQVQDREQTWLDLNVADPGSGEPTRLLRETTEAWVNVNGPPIWLADGSFLWLSERSGWKHLYHHRADGALDRVGIEGWSYGGFLVAYALTHSDRYAMGIAGGPVTDWRDYDTIYTERYLLTPQNNPEGYRLSAPRHAAADLAGALLLVHGTMDENVHMQNTLQFAYALQQAGKPFEMMLYPRSRHRLGGPDLERHRHETMLAFAVKRLRSE